MALTRRFMQYQSEVYEYGSHGEIIPPLADGGVNHNNRTSAKKVPALLRRI